MNFNFKLSDPNDPGKKRINNPHMSRRAILSGVNESDMSEHQKRLTERQRVKNRLTQHMYELASTVRLSNRDDIVNELNDVGFEVKRVTKKSISIKHPNFNKNIRLDNEIFSEGFDYRAGTKFGLKIAEGQYDFCREDNAHKFAKILNDGIKMKSKYHRERFDTKPPEPLKLSIDSIRELEAPVAKVRNDNDSPSFGLH